MCLATLGCCDSNYDVYRPQSVGGQFVRSASVIKINGSETSDGLWDIPPNGFPAVQNLGSGFVIFGGYLGVSEKVWRVAEQRSNNANPYLVFYDAVTKKELFSLDMVAITGDPVFWTTFVGRSFSYTGGGSSANYSQSGCGLWWQGGRWITIDGSGGIVITSGIELGTAPITSITTGSNALGPYHTFRSNGSISVFPPRNYPQAAGVTTQYSFHDSGAAGLLNGPMVQRFVLGDVAVVNGFDSFSAPGRGLFCGDASALIDKSLTSITLGDIPFKFAPRWVSFDGSASNWIGEIFYYGSPISFESSPDVVSGTGKRELWSNGRMIFSVILGNDADSNPINRPELAVGSPHACHPSSAGVDGYCIAAINLNYDGGTRPKPCTLIMYRQGSEQWRLPLTFAIAPTVLTSSDKWIYFVTIDEPASISTMTGGRYSGAASGSTAQYWMVSHDGSIIMPAGRQTATPNQRLPWQFGHEQWAGGLEAVKNTGLMSVEVPTN